MKTRRRFTIYLGVKDKDILVYIEPLLKRYDFSFVVRELMRDGIKYRKGEEKQVITTRPSPDLFIKESLSEPRHNPQPEPVLEISKSDEDDLLSKLDSI